MGNTKIFQSKLNMMIPLRHCINLSASLARPLPCLTRHLSTTRSAPIQVGDSIPSVDLFEGAPNNKVNLADVCKEGKFIIFGVPGAFTPGCSKTHLPGYVAHSEDLKGKGFKQIFCVSVNDPFVMAAWGESQNAGGRCGCWPTLVRPSPRPSKVDLDLTAVLGTVRCKRFSIL